MNTLKEFKEASELIYTHRKEIKTEMDNLAKNLYSALNQMNFSVKLIVDADHFINKYINSEDSIYEKLLNAIGENAPVLETTINLYENIAFNNLFASSIIYFENFSKILIESVSHYLIDANSTDVKTLVAMYNDYCTAMFIKNDWLPYKKDFDSLYLNYKNIFTLNTLEEGVDTMSNSQQRLLTQYKQYKKVFDDISTIFITGSTTQFTLSEVSDILIPAIQGIINFKTGSTLYDAYLNKLSVALLETRDFFTRLMYYIEDLIKHNIEYQSQFKTDNTYITTLIEVCTISTDLLSTLILNYPNKESYKNLILDGNFTKVLTTINNLFRREIETASNLIDTISSDYRYIKSLEAFISADKSLSNKEIFKIMNNFDLEISSEKEKLTLSNYIRKYFDVTGISGNAFSPQSFTMLLSDAMALTDPLYDALNYYRLFLYPFSSNTSLIFDFLETLHLFNIQLTNQTFTTAMSDLFEIKIKNIDYKNINESKVNESITSRYESLNNLNYFNIQPFIDIIKQTNLSTISTIDHIINLFNTTETYNLILFQLIENILYNNIDISLVMKTLSIKTNIRTLLFKIFFSLAINKLITTIEAQYTTDMITNVPQSLSIYQILINSNPTLDETLQDLSYLQLLSNAIDIYNGNSTIFNKNRITNFDSIINDYIWDQTKIDKIKNLFSLYKEV